MVINTVRVSGFNNLFDGFKACFNENRSGFGCKFFEFLSHTMIGVELNHITSIELYYLKKFSTNISILDEFYENFINDTKDSTIHDNIEGLLALHNEILHDDDIDKKRCDISGFLPIGCKQYHVSAIFNGSMITNVTGAFISDIFKSKKDGSFPESYMGNALMENVIAQLFYSSFYSYIANQLGTVDVVSDFMNTKKIYNYCDDYCSLGYINSVFGEINLLGNSKEHLQYQFNNIKETLKSFPFVIESQVFLTFLLNTTFSTFMDLYLNTNCVTINESLNLIFVSEHNALNEDVINKYGVRINSYTSNVINYKKELISSDYIDINRFNFITNGTKIKYCIQVSLDNVDKLIDAVIDNDEGMHIKNSIENSLKVVRSMF